MRNNEIWFLDNGCILTSSMCMCFIKTGFHYIDILNNRRITLPRIFATEHLSLNLPHDAQSWSNIVSSFANVFKLCLSVHSVIQ